MLKRFPDIIHYEIVIANVNIVVQADKGVGLPVYSLDGLFGANHKGKHLCVVVRVIRREVAPAYLPCAEKFRSIVGQGSEPVGRCFRQFFLCGGPNFMKCALEIRLGIVRGAQGDKLIIKFKDVVPARLHAIALVEPFVVVERHHLFLVEMAIDNSNVVFNSPVPLRP